MRSVIASIIMRNIRAIGKPVGTLDILVHLYHADKATITNLIKDTDLNQRTAYSALSSLLEQKLVCLETGNGFPLYKYYSLTKRGKAIAGHLDIVDKLLVEEFDKIMKRSSGYSTLKP
jgi:DNA-binding transcriptional ArsR family regulator